MQCCYICRALPQRRRLSIDRLSSVPPPPACLPSFMSRCNLFFGPAALTAAFPDAASRPALRADTEMRKDQGHLPVMNPPPHLALSFAHRRRLLFIFRLLYHALVGLPNWPDLRPCHTLLHANAHPGPTSDGAIVADLSASSSVSSPSSPRTPGTGIAVAGPRELPVDQRCNPPFVLENDIPCCSLAHSDSLPIASIPYSCATSPAPATCQPCALTQATSSAWEPFAFVLRWPACDRHSLAPLFRLLLRNPSMIDRAVESGRATPLL